MTEPHHLVTHIDQEISARGAARPPLRVGIMVDSLSLTGWVAKIITDIQKSSIAQVVLVVRNAAPARPREKSLRKRLKTYWTHSLFERYRRWDRKRSRVEPDAFDLMDMTDALKDVPVLSVTPLQKGFTDRFPPESISCIRDANLDVLFRFGFRIIRGEILSCAKYGIWSFHHGDSREYRGAPPGFWEMYEGSAVTGSILQVLTESLDGGRVIYRSLSGTNFDSLYRTLNPLYWKTAEFAMRRLYDLHEYGWGYLQALEEFNEDSSYTRRIYRTPGTPVMAHFLARLTARKLYRRAGSLFGARRNKWFIAYRHRVGLRTALTDRKDFHVIFPPRGRFYADPFLIERQGKTYLFFEDFDYSKNRAGISSVELRDKDFSQPTTVLEKPYHLSYPFLLEWEGHVYMIPETRERGTIELYRAVDFPQKWELCNILAEGVLAVDPTIFPHNGKLWLFANISVPGASTFDELHLFYADSLEGKWTPHPKNPIVSDVRRARPAGALFFEGHKLIRPSQDCSVRYGGSLSFNEVQVLSETDYREKPYGVIRPDWFPRSVCTHTYNRTDQYEVLDGMLIGRV